MSTTPIVSLFKDIKAPLGATKIEETESKDFASCAAKTTSIVENKQAEAKTAERKTIAELSTHPRSGITRLVLNPEGKRITTITDKTKIKDLLSNLARFKKTKSPNRNGDWVKFLFRR